MESLHAVAARWWADRHEPVRAIEHAAQSGNAALLTELLHRFAVPLILAGDHGPLRRALAHVGVEAKAADPWLSLDVRAHPISRPGSSPPGGATCATRGSSGLSDGTADLAVLRAVVEQFGDDLDGPSPSAIPEADELPAEPELEALARLSRGRARLERDDRAGARAEFDATLTLSRRHGFAYLTMQCLVLLGVVAGNVGRHADHADGEQRGSGHSRPTTAGGLHVVGHRHGDAGLCRTSALRGRRRRAPRRRRPGRGTDCDATLAAVRTAGSVHGAAVFDLGNRADGLAEMQRARSDFGGNEAGAEQCGSAGDAGVPRRTAARALGGSANRPRLVDRAHADSGELLVMRAWTETAGGRHDRARALIRPVLDGSVPALLPQTVVDSWLLETSIAVVVGERPAARRALQTALASPSRSTPFVRSPRPDRASVSCWCTSTAASEPWTSSRTGR